MKKGLKQHIISNWLRVSLLVVCLFIGSKSMAQQDISPLDSAANEWFKDSVDISLITCEPHSMIYALYGHTAIRLINHTTNEDYVANWGIFDQSKKFFAVRFAFGLTDYCMAIEPWWSFIERYEYFNCGIREQLLNLSPEEKVKIWRAILINWQPANRTYRYNFFYDNCTTRARDIIVENLNGKIDYNIDQNITTPYREEIHQWNFGHLWARWGNDFLLGVGSDKKTDRHQQQFLPDTLRVDFNKAVVIENGKQRKLVKGEYWVTPSRYDWSKPGVFDELTSPLALGCYLLVITIVITMLELFKLNRRIWMYDAFMLLLSGIPGLILFLMIFSQHPTVSLNFQILIFNPLALVFGWKIIKSLRKGESCKWMKILGACVALGLFLSIWQTFAEGVSALALVLLLRFMIPSGLKKNEKK